MKCGSGLSKGLCLICASRYGNNPNPNSLNDSPNISENVSQSPPHIDHHCCYECGDSLDDIFCQRCTCKSCGNNAHYGYNCPPKVPIISNPEPCNNQTVDELPQTLPSFDPTCYSGDGNSFTYDSTPNFVNDSPNVFNPPPQLQYVPYSCELCGNDADHGYDCPPQVPFVYNQDPCFNQNFDYFLQTSPSFPQQYPCCEDCGGPHETFQCQPMNYYEPNPCYDSNYFGFDQFQPPQYTVNHQIFNAQNELLNSQNKIMEQMTSICDMVGQYMQKKEEEKRIAEDQAAKDRYWKIPICYDDDDDEESSIPLKDIISGLPPCIDLLIEEFAGELALIAPIPPGIVEANLDPKEDIRFIENLMYDNSFPRPPETLKDDSETVIDSNNDYTSSDDDSYEDIDYVDASPPDSELVSLGEVKDFHPEDGEIEDDILREKLSKINLLIAKIEALKDNPTPSSDVVTKSPSTFPNSFLEETNTFDNSIPESETFCFDLEENSSGSTTTLSDYSLPDYEAFYLDDDHIEEKSSGSTTTHADFSQYDSFIFDLSINPFPPADRSDFYHEEFAGELAHIISPSEYDHFYFKIEPELGNFTMDVVEDIFDNPTREPRVHVPNVLPTHPTLHLDSDFTLSSDPLGSNLVVSFPSRTRNKIFDPGIFIGVQSMIFLSPDEFSFSFIRDPPLPVIDTLLPFSSKNENKVVNTGILASEEKSPPYSSHRGFKASKLSHHKSPMLIHGDNTPNLGVRHPHFYPP
ncbi:hypothetical protein Tco_0507615 [Tanacetum coccineum]